MIIIEFWIFESARSPGAKQSRTLALFLRMDEIRGKTTPILAETRLQDHLGGPLITLYKDFSQGCKTFHSPIRLEFHVLFEICLKKIPGT